MTSPADLNDSDLEFTIKRSVRERAKVTARILALLIEVERRDLHLRRAFNSVFAYCTGALAMSEGSARKHIYVARRARQFPELLEAVAAGHLHLSGACAISSRLTEDNVTLLIYRASGKTRRKIEEMLAEKYPRPDVAPTLRRLPSRPAKAPPNPAPTDPPSPPSSPTPSRRAPSFRLTSPPTTHAEPLSADRFKLTITIDRETSDALKRLVGLRRHAVPSGDLATIVSEAIVHELDRVQKRRFGSEHSGRAASAAATMTTSPERPTRPIPASVRRTVYDRDGGRCTYICPDTRRRCNTDDALELHHIDPWARHRIHDADRITLRCRAHNQLQARLDFGAAHVQAHIDRKAR